MHYVPIQCISSSEYEENARFETNIFKHNYDEDKLENEELKDICEHDYIDLLVIVSETNDVNDFW